MSYFDEVYEAYGVPILFDWNGDKAAYTYYSADRKTSYPDLDSVIREDRWENEITEAGERRVRVREVSVRTNDLPTLQQQGLMVETDGTQWQIERVASQSPTVTWMQLSNRTAFEQTATSFRRQI